MRITCPNCGAKYEVPEEVIPEEGRDVQCSNCGDTWFQDRSAQAQPSDLPDEAASDPAPESIAQEDTSPEADVAQEVEEPAPVEAPDDAVEAEEDPADDQPEDEAPDVAETLAASEAEDWTETPPGDEPPADDDPEDSQDDDSAPEEEAGGPPDLPERVEIDPAVAEILRQEAEHETRLRSKEAESLESQGDLGLDEAPGDEASRRNREARDRMARMRGETPPEEDTSAVQSGSRSGLLPDIEEINSTLRTGGEEDAPPEALEMVAQKGASGSGGFARGFGLMILIAILLALVYANAPRITEQVPALAGLVDGYVGMVDNLRLWLDRKLSGFIPR